jgi:hypothetical protein
VSAVSTALHTPEAILADAASSSWIRTALQSALTRDPVDALNDALTLAAALDAHLRMLLGLEERS